MAQQTAWDWKKIVLVIVAAAVAMVLVLAAAATGGFVWATRAAARLGEPTPEPVTRTIAIRDAGAEAVAAASERPLLRLEIELQDGEFEIRPGPAGTGVQVNGAYAKAYYELTEEHTPAGDPAGPATLIRLRPTQSFWVRLAAQALDGTRGTPNTLTVTIPKQVPIALILKLHTGETRTDLGGLHLTDLEAELSMGEHRLDFSQPLSGRLRRMRVDGAMGEIRIEGIGNARPLETEVSGRMGSLTADLGGDWSTDAVADLTFDSTMGELRLDVPHAVRIAPDSDASAVLGEAGRIPTGTGASGGVPQVRLHLSATMGEIRVRRY